MKSKLEEDADDFEKFAAKLALAEAWSRKECIDHLTHRISGAYLEFYKSKLASKNGLVKWTEHWMNEATRLIQREFFADLAHPIKGFKDRRKVYESIKAERKAYDSNFRRMANNVVKRDFAIKDLPNQLDDNDMDELWTMIDNVVEDALK